MRQLINSVLSENEGWSRIAKLIVPIVICGISLLMVSCGGSTTGTDGGGNNGGSNEDEIGMEPTFTNVQQIFEQSCGGGSCHISQGTNGVKLDTYDNVMNSEGTQYGKKVVQPEEPDNSPLVDKIESNPQYGARMPDGGPYLSDDRIKQIRDWISDGAKNN